jgi:hypothetical protein
MAGPEGTGAEATGEMRSLALTPTWSVATVLTLLVASSLIIERSIHRLSNVCTPLQLCPSAVFLSVSFNSWSELRIPQLLKLHFLSVTKFCPLAFS